MEETTATPEQTEEKDPFSPADVMTISITRASLELMRKDAHISIALINKLDGGDQYHLSPARKSLLDFCRYLDAAMPTNPAPEIKKPPACDLGRIKKAPYPDVNGEKPFTSQVFRASDLPDVVEVTIREPEPTEEPAPLRAHIDFEAPGEFVPTPEPEPTEE